MPFSKSEMTVALLARGLDPGIGMFHADIDGRSSLSLDAIEVVRPYVEYWLITYLQSTVFANRDFHELPDGEVRLSHPLNAHLAHTAALWRKACEPVAEWLAKSFECAARVAEVRAALAPTAALTSRADLRSQILIPTVARPLPDFISTASGRRLSPLSVLKRRASVNEEPVPMMCWECGRALSQDRRTFCSDNCAGDYRRAMGKRRPAVEAVAPAVRERHRRATVIRQSAGETLPKSDRNALRRWYTDELQPRLSRMNPTEIEQGAAVGRSYSYYIVAGARVPHPRHYANLAALVDVQLPDKLAEALRVICH